MSPEQREALALWERAHERYQEVIRARIEEVKAQAAGLNVKVPS